MKYFFRRYQYITHRKVQLKLASVFLFWFLIFIGVSAFIFMVNFAASAARTDGMMMHDKLMTRMLLVQQTKDIALLYGAATFAYLVLVWSYILVYSHRLTGPIYKLTKALDKAAKNQQWPAPIKFRRRDAFAELAESFNEFVAAMQKDQKK